MSLFGSLVLEFCSSGGDLDMMELGLDTRGGALYLDCTLAQLGAIPW